MYFAMFLHVFYIWQIHYIHNSLAYFIEGQIIEQNRNSNQTMIKHDYCKAHFY